MILYMIILFRGYSPPICVGRPDIIIYIFQSHEQRFQTLPHFETITECAYIHKQMNYMYKMYRLVYPILNKTAITERCFEILPIPST